MIFAQGEDGLNLDDCAKKELTGELTSDLLRAGTTAQANWVKIRNCYRKEKKEPISEGG